MGNRTGGQNYLASFTGAIFFMIMGKCNTMDILLHGRKSRNPYKMGVSAFLLEIGSKKCNKTDCDFI